MVCLCLAIAPVGRAMSVNQIIDIIWWFKYVIIDHLFRY